MGNNAWSNPGPARQVIIAGNKGELLVYNGPPAAGNLILAISGQNGTDKYGNSFLAGFNSYLNVVGFDFFNFLDQATQALLAVIAALPGTFVFQTEPGIAFTIAAPTASLSFQGDVVNIDTNGPAGVGQINIQSDHQTSIIATDTGLLLSCIQSVINILSRTDLKLQSAIGKIILDTSPAAATGLQIGAGPVGKYYQEKVACDPAQVFTTNVLTTLTNLVPLVLRSDYGSRLNLGTGTWTCPATGTYRFTWQANWGAWVASSRARLSIINNTTAGVIADTDNASVGITGHLQVMAEDEFSVGDTVNFQALQNTAANKSLLASSHILIARTL